MQCPINNNPIPIIDFLESLIFFPSHPLINRYSGIYTEQFALEQKIQKKHFSQFKKHYIAQIREEIPCTVQKLQKEGLKIMLKKRKAMHDIEEVSSDSNHSIKSIT